jgi:fatty acid desaturase
MPMPPKYRDELVAKHEAAHRDARKETTRDLLKTCGHMLFWVACGWAFIGLSAHTTNEVVGWVLFWGGLCVWIPGVLFSLLAAYRRGEKRGDW